MDGVPILPECDHHNLVFPCRRKRGVFRNEREYIEHIASRNQRRIMTRILTGRRTKDRRKIIKHAKQHYNETGSSSRKFRQVRFKSNSKSNSKSRSRSNHDERMLKRIMKFSRHIKKNVPVNRRDYLDIVKTEFGDRLFKKNKWKIMQVYDNVIPKPRRRKSAERNGGNSRNGARRRRTSTYERRRRSI